MRITLSKGSRYSGRARLPETYKVKVDGKEAGTIQRAEWNPYTREKIDPVKCWFWYADGINTASNPKSLEDCKAEMKAHLKSKHQTK